MIIQSVGVWKARRQNPLSVGQVLFRTDGLRDPQRVRRQTQLCQVMSGTGQLLFYQLQPPLLTLPPSSTTLALHMFTGHMLIQLVNMTVKGLIERTLRQHYVTLSYNFAIETV